ncbi:hypothetical protein Tco_1335380 [Tanacetum coccineum]
MAVENVPAPAPTRFDDQILPFAAWVPIGKSNYVLDLQKKQKNPIFQIYVDILQNTNFFIAFTASASITPIDQAHHFVSPPSGYAIMDFVNENVEYFPDVYSLMSKNDLLRLLGYNSTSSNVDFAELMWEEFVQAIQTFLTDKGPLLGKFRLRGAGKTSLMLFRIKISDLVILNSFPKAKKMKSLMPNSSQTKSCNQKERKEASAKQPKSKSATGKSSKPAPALKPKPAKEKPSKPSTAKPPKPKPAKATPLQKADKGKVAKVHNVKSCFQLVDEPDEEPAQSEPETEPKQEGEGEEYDMERAIQMSLESFQAHGHAHARATEEASTGPSTQPHDDTSANIVRDNSSLADAETGADIDRTNSGGDTEILQIGVEQGDDVKEEAVLMMKTRLDQPQEESVVAFAGTRTQSQRSATDELHALNLYPKVQESLKFPADDHVILEEPLSSSRTLSLMKNLDDAYTIRDHFINDKATEDESEKLNVESDKWSPPWLPFQFIKRLPQFHQWHIGMNILLNDKLIRETRYDDQDPPPPPTYSDISKKKRHDSGASGSSHPSAPHLFAWKMTDTREAPSSSSKKQYGPHSEQPVEDIPMSNTTNISDSEDIGSAHLPKNTLRPEWLKPIPEEDRPATPKLAWVIPTSHIPDKEMGQCFSYHVSSSDRELFT